MHSRLEQAGQKRRGRRSRKAQGSLPQSLPARRSLDDLRAYAVPGRDGSH